MLKTFFGLVAATLLSMTPIDAKAQSDEAVFWQSISGSSDSAEFCAYLETYPNGKFAALAKLRAKKLGGACNVTPAPRTVRKLPTPAPTPAPTPVPTTPRPKTPPSTAEMESAHKQLTISEIDMVGFPRATPQFRELTIKQCFDCAEVKVICNGKTVSGAHQLGAVKVAVMDWPTAGPTLGWVKQFNRNPLTVDPENIYRTVADGNADCAVFGGGMLRYGNWDRNQQLAKLAAHLNLPPPTLKAPTQAVASAPKSVAMPAIKSVGPQGILSTAAKIREVLGAADDGVAIKWEGGRCTRLEGDKTTRTVSGKGGPNTANHFTDSEGDFGIWGIKKRGGVGANFCLKHSTSDQWDCWKLKTEGSVVHFHPPVGFGERNFSGIILAPERYKDCPSMSFNELVDASKLGASRRSPAAFSGAAIKPLDKVMYTLKNANVRDKPSASGAKLFVMNKGEQVQVTGKVPGENWYQVSLSSNNYGYIFGTLLGDQRPGSTGTAASAPTPSPNTKPASSAASSSSSSNLPSIDEANGPLCDFFGEGNGWKLYAGFESVAVTSMDEREKFQVHNGFEANGVGLSVSEEESGKKISVDLFNVEKNGEVFYDRREAIGAGDIKYKMMDAKLSLSAGGEATTVSASSVVFDFSVGGSGSHADFDLPISWMMEKLRAGHEIAIDVFLQGSRAVSMTFDTNGFIDAFRHVNRARSKMASNRANGRCGFGAGRPSASNGLLACTQVASREAGNFEGARFAVIPGKWAKTAKEHADASPHEVDVIDSSFPVYEILNQVGYFPIDGVVFYDRNIRVRENPNGGGPLIIGEFGESDLFKQMTKKFEPNNFRCELVAEVRTCPHPKYAWASEPCQ